MEILVFSEYLPPLVFSLVGAAVRFFWAKDERSLGAFFANLLVCLFVSALAYCSIAQFNPTIYTHCIVAGLSSFCSGEVLPLVASAFKKRVEKEVNK